MPCAYFSGWTSDYGPADGIIYSKTKVVKITITGVVINVIEKMTKE